MIKVFMIKEKSTGKVYSKGGDWCHPNFVPLDTFMNMRKMKPYKYKSMAQNCLNEFVSRSELNSNDYKVVEYVFLMEEIK